MCLQVHDRTGRRITLGEITDDNWRDLADVAPSDDQRRFVFALAGRYLLMSSREDDWHSLAVMADGSVIGHVMWALDPGDGTHWIGGMMIDYSEQGKGVGRAAVHACIAMLSGLPGAHEIRLSYHPDNVAAAALYEAIGFRPTGEYDDAEIVAALPVAR